ncbi:MAG TPA: hypothetical protein EYO58_10425 [Flavobacteriales bacterium]|nr:hypothetical protein [Flavobacteriales bacterium]
MKRSIIVGVLILYSTILCAGVEVSSFYFGRFDAIPNASSVCELSRLKDVMESHYFQIIEVNSFSDLNNTAEANEKLCLLRQNYILDYFNVRNENIIANIFGKKKVALNFVPSSWDRVDVYYYVGEQIITESPVSLTILTKDSSEENGFEKRELPLNKLPVTNVPVVLPIMFVGGTHKVKKESLKFLDSLYLILHNNEDLNVHIRGHVCCSNRTLMSKKRAKLVYKFLIKNVLDV